MNVNAQGRALQHLLVQGFTLYTVPAAVCTRLVDRALLDDPAHAWAVYFTAGAIVWTGRLGLDDPLREVFGDAAVRSGTPTTPHVVCQTQGGRLLLPLEVTDVREARMRIEAAVMVGKPPPEADLDAIPEPLLERELRRRARQREASGKPSDKT